MTYSSRLLAACVIGTAVGCMMAVIIAFISLLGAPPQGADGSDISQAMVAFFSIGGGLSAGLVVGVLQKLGTTLRGSAVLGMLAMTPWAVGFWKLYGSSLDQASLTSMGIISVLIGGGLGAYFGQGHTTGGNRDGMHANQ